MGRAGANAGRSLHGPGEKAGAGGTAKGVVNDHNTTVPAIEAGLEPWRLNGAMSRSTVLAAANGRELVVAGGLGSVGSDQGVYEVNPLNGADTQIGNLLAPLHDASGAVVNGKAMILGGGTATALDIVQQLPSLGGKGSSLSASQATASRLAPLPQARADNASVTIGSVAYVVGGYDGTNGDAAVLATSNGTRYRTVANLPVPVRYPAVAARGGRIYVFGGDATLRGPIGRTGGGGPDGRPRYPPRLGRGLAPAAGRGRGGGEPTMASSTWQGARPSLRPPARRRRRPRRGRSTPGTSARPAPSSPVTCLSRSRMPGSRWSATGRGSSAARQRRLPSASCRCRAKSAFGTAGSSGAGSPFFGDKLLIADRGNNRLLLLDERQDHLDLSRRSDKPAPPGGFYFPDDAFFIRRGTAIISNQEENETIVEIAYPVGRILWQYGHPRMSRLGPRLPQQPRRRVPAAQRRHHRRRPEELPRPRAQSRRRRRSPDRHRRGVRPQPSAVSSARRTATRRSPTATCSSRRSTVTGSTSTRPRAGWFGTAHLPIGYPSDPQQIGPDRYLVADYENPGAVRRVQPAPARSSTATARLRAGRAQPSVARRAAPVGGASWRTTTTTTAWSRSTRRRGRSSGSTARPAGRGTARGLLNTPDGFDILGPRGATPTHRVTD